MKPCAGFWITLAWWGAWQAWPHGTIIAASLFALSAAVGILGKADEIASAVLKSLEK